MATIPQERSRNRWRILDVVAAAVVTIGAIAYLADVLALRWGLTLAYISASYPSYSQAAWISIYATTIPYVLGMGIGFALGWVRSTQARPLVKVLAARRSEAAAATAADGGRSDGLFLGTLLLYGFKHYVHRAADAYVAIIRGTPLLVQIIFVWSAVIVYFPRLDPVVQGLLSGIIALTANTGGYQSEMFRAGIHTGHSGLVEAARAGRVEHRHVRRPRCKPVGPQWESNLLPRLAVVALRADVWLVPARSDIALNSHERRSGLRKALSASGTPISRRAAE